MRYTQDGVPVTNFSLATTEFVSKTGRDGDERPCPAGWKESYNGKGYELTTWWRVTAWRGLAETVNKYVGKGRLLYIEGTMQGEANDGNLNPRVWTGNDGVARASFELRAESVKFLERGEGNGGAPTGEAPPERGYEEDALPF